MPGVYWTDDEMARLERLFPHHSNKQLAEMFPGRSWKAIGRIGHTNGWKKAYYTNQQINRGYVLVKCPNHPQCDKDGYVREHRLVMERVLGRYLLPDEDVHHVNGLKTDNRPENLEVRTRSEHASHHQKGAKRSPEMRAKMRAILLKRYDKQVTAEALKEAILNCKSLHGACRHLGISTTVFYDRLRAFGLREWYKDACPNARKRAV